MPGFRVAPVCVVFDGQSLNNQPTASTYPSQLMANYSHPWVNVAIGGASWTDLTRSQSPRLNVHANSAATTILVMCGGTSDVWLEDDAAATVYADMVAYAGAAVTAGFNKVLGSTITPGSLFSGAENTQRLAANVLILADASNAFDGVADFAADPSLDDHTDVTYYSDGIHWTAAGAAAAAACMKVVLDAVL